ncbi:MAG TPA: tRNA (guanosine(46)-N7)-methyltransferase TrmB [Sedimentisphaerales bacterium]|nr:tRNA (guanosine(46)-N7)-methyltransferase TrmB [Sedimentisphaerales bacterium]
MGRILKDYPSVALAAEELAGEIDFARVFGRAGPVHIEIGCGKGTFLLNQARAQPEANFLGIEWANRYYRYAVDRMGRWGLTNVRMIRTDAAAFLAEYVSARSVDCFHIYFPDPWPKKRHHKRRFFSAANLDRLLQALRIGGAIRVATDHAEYFETITQLFEANTNRLAPTDFLPTAAADVGEWVGTNFERKYLKQNRPIFTIAVTKLL